jgi:hypothetical protein
MIGLLQFCWHWLRHLGYAHFNRDLGNIVRVETLPMGTTVMFRECAFCRRVFVEFSSGL